jgi:arylsulfatase A-like enzyme
MSKLNRRDFLKLAGAVPASLALSSLLANVKLDVNAGSQDTPPNVVILLFDAMTAHNLSVYGYPRETMPNLERFAERATVFHEHHSSGNFTIPGVASLLTGTYPWTHRAINHAGKVTRGVVDHNIFKAIQNGYHVSAFPQNVWANFIVTQFRNDIDTLLPSNSYGKMDYMLGDLFKNDSDMAYRALDDFLFKMDDLPPSMVFGPIERTFFYRDSARLSTEGYPKGIPQNVNYPLYFKLDELLQGVANFVKELKPPFFTYQHLFPPHSPYRPTYEFNKRFNGNDGLPIEKPEHRFSQHSPFLKVKGACVAYDRYLATLDAELGNCLDTLEKAGIMDNSYVIITADHGEMFERGEIAHDTIMLFDPVVHVPLLVSAPGQQARKDVYSFTNAVDLLPTIAHLTGNPIPDWAEGKLLPELGGTEDPERSTFSVEAKLNSAFTPLKKVSVAMYKGHSKLIYYTGYEPKDSFEMYDLYEDPEELNDLYPQQPFGVKALQDELLESLQTANKPFIRS